MSFNKRYAQEKQSSGLSNAINHIPFIPEIAKGIGHVVKNTIMEPANAVKTLVKTVNKFTTGEGIPTVDPASGHYYDSAPFHLTPTEVGAPGAAYLVNKSRKAIGDLMPKGKHEAKTFSERWSSAKMKFCTSCGLSTDSKRETHCSKQDGTECRQRVLEKLRGVDPNYMELS